MKLAGCQVITEKLISDLSYYDLRRYLILPQHASRSEVVVQAYVHQIVPICSRINAAENIDLRHVVKSNLSQVVQDMRHRSAIL